MSFAILKMLTGIFTQHAKNAFAKDKEETLEHEMMNLFIKLDEDGSGLLTKSEFGRLSKHPEIAAFFKSIDLAPYDADKLFRMIEDHNNGDGIDVRDFVASCKKV